MKRLKGLKRLGVIYDLIEEIHSAEARIAAADAGQAERAIHVETSTLQDAWIGKRDAVQGADTLGRSAMLAREDVARRKRLALEPVLRQRAEISENARSRHMASRLWSERIQCLIDAEAVRIAVEEDRRLQMASDDRFLARRREGRRKDDPA
ncbi:MAG TPA: hypothetical protein VGG95_03765 [Edaphobacter sp.]|jgi:hypothetical protein